ncbi:WhiB family transcriptional regulator [Corynebacterium phoceense]|uniref:WhiB family transcriptional regulator n=1 Tax=Corynebacterium phoceense TaxID=1686286 RepID=UPI003524E7CA
MSAGHDRSGHQRHSERHSGPYFVIVPEPMPRELIEDGLCAVDGVFADGTWDFSVDGESRLERDERRTFAERICAECPVRELCAAYAAANRLSGVWGGRLFRPIGRDGSCVQPVGKGSAPGGSAGGTWCRAGAPKSA